LKDGNNVYATLSKGYKSGGFNTQMFSDILQIMMKENMMQDLGISLENSISKYSISDIIEYKPEYIWNYEIGTHLFFFDKKLQADIALFYMDCRNQQLTIFPEGQTTGRMMTNAGLSRSLGFETSLKANLFDNISLMGSYGYVNSRFIDYNNGIQDYSNKYLPYAPSNTVSLSANYYIQMDNKYLNDINLGIKYIGLGSIYFDDANLISQDYYSLIDVYVSLHKGIFDLRLWAKNITNTKYNTFYFMSVGNSFVQRGKPLQWGLTLIMKV
jgi:outer membrane receptor protein involved in Fe transport